MSRFTKKNSCCFILLCIAHIVWSQEWYESSVIILENISSLTDPQQLILPPLEFSEHPKAYVEQSLKENRAYIIQLFSLVIYGYRFTYVPQDNQRNIEESWNFTPIAYILPDDINLHELDIQIVESQLSVVYRYNLSSQQATWLKGWESAEVIPSSGIGISYATDVQESVAKISALDDAIRSAIRDRMQQVIPTKPLEIVGLVKLESQPFIYKTGEFYNAKVKVKIKVENIKEQQVF